ncbi:MAG: peptide-methionine (S)-S-oxide reductase [Proteobacteria bacterium]|nr:peptide-methionine (S)-S-oxide reductase [Pseudomonadota bacterium]
MATISGQLRGHQQSRTQARSGSSPVVGARCNSSLLSTRALLEHFFQAHDPAQKNRQSDDVGAVSLRSFSTVTTSSARPRSPRATLTRSC